jgi:hypothetical protein
MENPTMNAPDLTKTFPRSPGEVLGGFVILARILDKCRAVIASTHGEYKFNCPLDRRFFDFTGIDAEEFKSVAAKGATDAQVVAWVKEKTRQLSDDEIAAWSYDQRARAPYSVDEKAYFEKYRQQFAPHARHAVTWFQMLDAEEKRCG